MQKWKKIAWPDEHIQVIYREWGFFYTQKQKVDIAADYYDISLALKNDPKALFNRSRCKRGIAQTWKALQDGRAALASNPQCQLYNLEVCDVLYELNRFEEAKSELHNNSQKFKGIKLKAFTNRLEVVDDNFEASLGKTLNAFVLQNEGDFIKSFEEHQQRKFVDRRPLWQIQKEQEKCDVMSVLEKEEVLLSPLEVARRNRAFRVFNQFYMRRSWSDILFLKELKNHPNLLLPQCKWSSPLVKQVTDTKYDATIKFLKILHARTPLYTVKVRKCPNRILAKQKTEDYLYRVQYQVHRNILTILERMRLLKKKKQVEKLSRYIEEVMGDYVVLKTKRVMPWKFEFIHEVYNLLALARLDQFLEAPKDHIQFEPSEHLLAVLRVKNQKYKDIKPFVFGDKSTYQDESGADLSMIVQKRWMARMEKRILFSKYPIEKAYAWHEIARNLFKNARYDETCIIVERAIDEAKKCNSFVWMLLGLLMTCKAHAAVRRIEKVHDTLMEAAKIAARLNNVKISRYISYLRFINEEDALEKALQEDMRQTKSTLSVHSSLRSSSVSD